jgi:hypothetical protein
MFWTFFTKFKEFFMKNALKLVGIIAIAAVIGFWAVSCGDDGDSGGEVKEIIGENDTKLVSGVDVIYDSIWLDDISGAKKASDFSLFPDWFGGGEYKPLSSVLDGSASVKVNNGKVTIIFGTPKSSNMGSVNNFLDAYFEENGKKITATPSDAKIFTMPFYFYTSDKKYYLEDHGATILLLYADNPLTLNGTYTYVSSYDDKENTVIINNVSLKKGWNYLITRYNDTFTTSTFSSSTTLPGDVKIYARD